MDTFDRRRTTLKNNLHVDLQAVRLGTKVLRSDSRERKNRSSANEGEVGNPGPVMASKGVAPNRKANLSGAE